jgi:hypothetical protein
MARAFLGYTKTILKKVSFNADLFQKELSKAFERLLPYEVYELKQWILEQFKNEPQLESCLVKVKKLENRF